MSSRWRGVKSGARIQQDKCESCDRLTPYLFKGFAIKVFRLSPILSGGDMLLGTLVKFVEAKVCQVCLETNIPQPKPKTEPKHVHCECSPRYTCCWCGEGKE